MVIELNENDLKYLVKKSVNEYMLTEAPATAAQIKAIEAIARKILGKKATGKSAEELIKLINKRVRWMKMGKIIKILIYLGIIAYVGGKYIIPGAKQADAGLEDIYSADGDFHYQGSSLVDYYNNPENKVDAIRARNREKYGERGF